MERIRGETSPEETISKEREQTFKQYIEGLRLTPDDFSKKILDVGSGSAEFAKWAKDHQVSSEIYSIDPQNVPQDVAKFQEREKAVKGMVQMLPFQDESFDLVVSHAAIPNIFWQRVDRRKRRIREATERTIRQSIEEMLRVTKRGGEVRMGRVSLEYIYPFRHILIEALNNVLNEIKKDQAVYVETIPTDESPLVQKEKVEYENFYKKTAPDIENLYLVKIKKFS
ncbi:MAG: class I SAM-dependent methyltransferase [Candidatus Portnoybacteria bacterium]|nr:class I SAM-dependent methyltransferase [Candidatus Portnoybacteria bacterium]